jgi:hypothetical protein
MVEYSKPCLDAAIMSGPNIYNPNRKRYHLSQNRRAGYGGIWI